MITKTVRSSAIECGTAEYNFSAILCSIESVTARYLQAQTHSDDPAVLCPFEFAPPVDWAILPQGRVEGERTLGVCGKLCFKCSSENPFLFFERDEVRVYTMLDLHSTLLEEVFGHAGEGLGVFNPRRRVDGCLCAGDGDRHGCYGIRPLENSRVDILWQINE